MRTTSDRLLWLVLLLPLITVVAAASAPFRFSTAREGAKVRSSATVTYQGQDLRLEERQGEIASRGVLLEITTAPAAVILWLEGSTGRQGRAAVYSLPAGKLLTQSGWYERAGLDPAGPGRFQITTPMRKLDLAPPWLRIAHVFELRGNALAPIGTLKGSPATPGQSIEWAAHEIDEGDAQKALEKLEAVLRDPVREAEQTAVCLHQITRAQRRLGRGPDLVATLNTLARAHADQPAGQAAREALAFIEKNGLEAYLKREEQ